MCTCKIFHVVNFSCYASRLTLMWYVSVPRLPYSFACTVKQQITMLLIHMCNGLQLQRWSAYIMTGSSSWAACGLTPHPNNAQEAVDQYDCEGHSWNLLRTAIQEWSKKHAFQEFHIRELTNGYHHPPQPKVTTDVTVLTVSEQSWLLVVLRLLVRQARGTVHSTNPVKQFKRRLQARGFACCASYLSHPSRSVLQ